MCAEGPFDLIIADPPYGDTSLPWDRRVQGWIPVALALLKPSGSMWVFGSMRYFLVHGVPDGWKYAQDIVWEKHNGSGFAVDRFKRVHEHVVQFYPQHVPWADVWNSPQTTPDAQRKLVKRRKSRPPHMGDIPSSSYQSEDGGPRIMRSVVEMRSMHGRAIHPTEKPSSLVEILIRTSCPPNGLVGDFFAGSASAGEAALMSGRHYVGCEVDPRMARKAQDRLSSLLPLGDAA
jgi:site-specific DNA-methyltransferase (adenine-specific)